MLLIIPKTSSQRCSHTFRLVLVALPCLPMKSNAPGATTFVWSALGPLLPLLHRILLCAAHNARAMRHKGGMLVARAMRRTAGIQCPRRRCIKGLQPAPGTTPSSPALDPACISQVTKPTCAHCHRILAPPALGLRLCRLPRLLRFCARLGFRACPGGCEIPSGC